MTQLGPFCIPAAETFWMKCVLQLISCFESILLLPQAAKCLEILVSSARAEILKNHANWIHPVFNLGQFFRSTCRHRFLDETCTLSIICDWYLYLLKVALKRQFNNCSISKSLAENRREWKERAGILISMISSLLSPHRLHPMSEGNSSCLAAKGAVTWTRKQGSSNCSLS